MNLRAIDLRTDAEIAATPDAPVEVVPPDATRTYRQFSRLVTPIPLLFPRDPCKIIGKAGFTLLWQSIETCELWQRDVDVCIYDRSLRAQIEAAAVEGFIDVEVFRHTSNVIEVTDRLISADLLTTVVVVGDRVVFNPPVPCTIHGEAVELLERCRDTVRVRSADGYVQTVVLNQADIDTFSFAPRWT